MSRTMLTLSSFALVAAALPLIAARPVAAPAPSFGPPWISVEMPANPLDPTTRDAAFVVRTYRHDQPQAVPLTGTAEGVVDGGRQSIPLQFQSTGQPGVFTVDQRWPERGAWVLAISTGEQVHMMIELGPDGGVTRTTYHGQDASDLALRSIRVVTGKLPKKHIDQTLETLALGS